MGPAARYQAYSLIPLALGAIVALVVGGRPDAAVPCALGGVVFAVLMLAGSRLRVVIDGDRLVMRNSIWFSISRYVERHTYTSSELG